MHGLIQWLHDDCRRCDGAPAPKDGERWPTSSSPAQPQHFPISPRVPSPHLAQNHVAGPHVFSGPGVADAESGNFAVIFVATRQCGKQLPSPIDARPSLTWPATTRGKPSGACARVLRAGKVFEALSFGLRVLLVSPASALSLRFPSHRNLRTAVLLPPPSQGPRRALGATRQLQLRLLAS